MSIHNPVTICQEDASSGDSVAQKSTGGAAHVRTVATDVAASADYVKEDSVTLTASATDELTISNMDGYKTLQFTVSGLTTDTLAVKLGYDTDVPPTLVTGEVTAHDLSQVNQTTDVLVSSGGNGDYVLKNLSCKSVWFDRTGGTDTPVITWKARKS